MKSLSEAKSDAEKRGTKKATDFRKKTLRKVIIGITVVAILAIWTIKMTSFVEENRQKQQASAESAPRSEPEIPLASSPIGRWRKVQLPPYGKSELIPIPAGGHMNTTAEEFRLHTVYMDGRECESSQRCPDGALKGFYLVNTSARTIVVSYAFEGAT